MDLDAPDYSIVVPAYNEQELLPGTLASVCAAMVTTPLLGEIVVCDNNSVDRTSTVAAAHGARVVFEPVNQIARARNAGARVARGRFLVFVDADTHVPPGVLREALAALRSGRVVGGGATVSIEFGTNRAARALLGLWNRLSVRGRLAAGSFLFCRRDAFEAVGGFPETVYASEELWLSRSLKRWGRPRGLAFAVLAAEAVRSSGRKGEWYGSSALLGTTLLLLLCPLLVRSKRFCWLWYRRPRPAV